MNFPAGRGALPGDKYDRVSVTRPRESRKTHGAGQGKRSLGSMWRAANLSKRSSGSTGKGSSKHSHESPNFQIFNSGITILANLGHPKLQNLKNFRSYKITSPANLDHSKLRTLQISLRQNYELSEF